MYKTRFFTYELKNQEGNYVLAKTKEGKIVVLKDKESIKVISQRTSGLLRILDLTEDIELGNIPRDRIEILN